MFDRMSVTPSGLHDLLAHFPPKVSQEIVDYARDVVFKWSQYLFVRRVGKKQYAYCTHCGKEFETGGSLKHNERMKCYECGNECTVKASGRGRKKMIDEAYFVWYEKSLLNPQAIVARGIYAVRDYRENFFRVETQFEVISMYLFEPDSTQMLKRNTYYSEHSGKYSVGQWEQCRSVYSLVTNNTMSNHISNIRFYCSPESIKEAVKGTPFGWSGWESYDQNYDGDMVKFFALFSKYPCVEYLTKLGFYNLVVGKLSGYDGRGIINWRGKTLFKVLKLNKQELNAIKALNIHVTFDFLKALQFFRTNEPNFSPPEVVRAAGMFDSYYYLTELQKLHKYGDYKKLTSYLLKQHQKHSKNISSATSALIAWRDYIDDCGKLGMDLEKDSVLFPNDLYAAHQNTIRQLKMKADESLNKKIALRVKSLEKLRFEYAGLFIRPAANSLELLDEGEALNHCVYRNYAEKYAKGETNILLIRKDEEPETPFYTLELKGKTIIQVKGFKNCDPTDEVQWFIEAFTEEKLTRKKTKKNIR